MKRKHRYKPFIFSIIEANKYRGDIIPPRSEVKLLAPWGHDQGRRFRIGYYSRMDGLNCVWLVNEAGRYEQSTDQASIRNDFELLMRSDETDLFGANRSPLKSLSS